MFIYDMNLKISHSLDILQSFFCLLVFVFHGRLIIWLQALCLISLVKWLHSAFCVNDADSLFCICEFQNNFLFISATAVLYTQGVTADIVGPLLKVDLLLHCSGLKQNIIGCIS